MRVSDLIIKLQELEDKHDEYMLGPCVIMIDVFDPSSGYKGIDGSIEITYTDDGVYPVLTSTETWKGR